MSHVRRRTADGLLGFSNVLSNKPLPYFSVFVIGRAYVLKMERSFELHFPPVSLVRRAGTGQRPTEYIRTFLLNFRPTEG